MSGMSQTTAIAGVTTTLKDVLQSALTSMGAEDPHLSDVLITTLPVDRARTVHHRGQLNLTLATVVENPAMRNAVGLGSRAAASGAAGAPAVDLLYLMTAYGADDDDVGAQRVLGAVLKAVHQQPVLPPIALDTLFPNTGATGTLAQLRVTQASLTRDQIVAWWLAFHTPYRLSAALQVTGVNLG
jgi:hypothetical protein